MSIISIIVDHLHVSTSDVQVVRHMRKRLRGNLEKEKRKEIYREALLQHRKNQRLYRAVQTGNFALLDYDDDEQKEKEAE